eukprot:TRINITY_DN7367_c0_g1_i2.p1 TRINITY_DN7367_c0_g1~~TRINITY_DN7367_c0_g1_i2.p1  ORF type:complete len:316 (-),score=48.87 TRINITY_DN7367_c0_g1_i2:6-953(-)
MESESYWGGYWERRSEAELRARSSYVASHQQCAEAKFLCTRRSRQAVSWNWHSHASLLQPDERPLGTEEGQVVAFERTRDIVKRCLSNINMSAIHSAILERETDIRMSDIIVLNIGLWLEPAAYPHDNWADLYETALRLMFRYLAHLKRLNRLQLQRDRNDDGMNVASTSNDRWRKMHLVFRTTPARHFIGGDWSSGGYCRDTMPQSNVTYESFYGGQPMRILNQIAKRVMSEPEFGKDIDMDNTQQQQQHQHQHQQQQQPKLVRLFDVVPATMPRSDAHVDQTGLDCSHYCMPGVIDDVWVDMFLRLVSDHYCF